MTLNISLSREEIRKQLLQYYAKILEVDESQLDLSDTSFSSFVINSLSTLASNTLIYGSLIYNESSLVTAQLPESIINWARYLDYTPKSATSSIVDILIKIPLVSRFKTIIKSDHKFYANDIIFTPKYDYEINLTQGIQIYKLNDIPIPIPYQVITENNIEYVAFTIPVYQEYIEIEEFTVPSLKPYEFYSQTININTGYVIDVKVFVGDEEWKSSRIIFSEPNENVFEWIVLENKLKIMFGNGLVGRQPFGIVKVQITLTDGSKGNVGPGTITKGDALYTSEDPPTRVDYTVNNIVGATGGSDLEQLIDIKRNAPKSLSLLKRIVSSTDYVNIFKILYNEEIQVIPILKRSDIAINDIILYSTFKWNSELIPTTSIYTNYDPTIDYYPMYNVFTFDGEEWVCPFFIEIDHETQVAYYRYIPEDTPLNFYTSTKSEDSKVSVISGKITYDYISDLYTVKITTAVFDPSISVTQTIQARFTNTWKEFSPTNVQAPIQNLYIFEYVIPRSELHDVKAIDVYSYQDGTLSEISSTTYEEIDLSLISSSQIYKQKSDGTYIITDIPVILKSWYDNLPIDEQKALTQYIVSRMLTFESNLENRMINVNINIKFAKTYGKLVNLNYSEEDFIVKGIVYSSTDITSPNLGDMYAVSDPIDPNDTWYQYAGYLAVWGGTNWSFFKPGTGTIIRNSADGNIYSTDGRRWFKPNYNNPLKLDIEVYTSSYTGDIFNTILETVLTYINDEVGIEESVYLSKITDKLHDIPDVNWVRIVEPMSDIIYRRTYKNLSDDELAKYVPEYIYTTPDNVKITINIGR